MRTVATQYIAMPHAYLSDGTLLVRAVQLADIEAIRQWRNAQMDVLRQTEPISQTEQNRYFAQYVWPEMIKSRPTQILVALESDGTLIGYGGLVNISWPNLRAEVSFLLSPQLEKDSVSLTDLFTRFLTLLKRLAFEDLRLRRLFTETYAHRTRHIAILETAGFLCEGRLREHVLIDGKPMDAILHGVLSNESNDDT